jgi:hypothetical protein
MLSCVRTQRLQSRHTRFAPLTVPAMAERVSPSSLSVRVALGAKLSDRGVQDAPIDIGRS